MHWKVIKYEIIEKFPYLCTLIQDAGNLVQGACQQESVLQCLLKLKQSMATKKTDIPNDVFAASVLKHNENAKSMPMIWPASFRHGAVVTC